MNEAKITTMVRKTMNILEKIANEVVLQNVTTEQEIHMLSSMAPVILAELILDEKNSQESSEQNNV